MRAIDGDRIVKILNESINIILAIQGNLEIADNPKLSAELQVYKDMLEDINEMPTIEPRKKGKWIPVTNGIGGFECDQCHNYAPSYQDGVEWLSGYCPNCGADMRGKQDE